LDPRQQGILEKAAASGFNEGIDSEGGFLVQQEFQAELWQMAFDTGVLSPLADTTPIGAGKNGLYWNAVKDESRATGSRRGGIRVYRTAEAAAMTESKAAFERRQMLLEKLTGLYYATDELLEDSTALASMVKNWFGEEFAFVIDDEMVRGSGAGQMLGILNADCLVSIAKETGQTAATIVSENIENMWTSMAVRSLAKAKWFINQECWPQLFRLHRKIGTSGIPLFTPPNGLVDAPFGMILGRPIVPIEHCEALGTVGDIVFADFSQYKVINKAGVKADSSIHVRFLYNETTFRFTIRNNGQPLWKKVLTPYKGSIEISPFIVLATRS